jgi:hypothetical protein
MVTMLVLALVAIIGLASMESVTRDRQVAGYQSRSRVALYAAEAGVATALGIIRRDSQWLADGGTAALVGFSPAFPDASNKRELGSDPVPPSFHGDPDATKTIRYVGSGDPCWADDPDAVMSLELGGVQWRDALWEVRTVGEAVGGTRSRIQATSTHCHPYNE